MDDYNKQIEAYSKAVDDYNAYIEKWNAGPRTEDPTMQPPKELPFTQAELDTFSEAAANTAQKTAAQRELALAVMANPQQYNLAGFGFADGGEASKARLAYNKMFPQKFVVGGPAMAVQNAAAMMAPPAGAPAAEVSPSALQQFMNMITGETARREAETEAYLSQPVAQPATPRLDPAAYAEALRSVQESRISGGVIAPDADEREKTRREMERLSRPGGFAPAPELPSTPGFEPPTIDTAPTSLPAAEQLKSLPGFKPVEQGPEDLIMRSEDDAENTLRFSDKRFKQLTSEHEADPFDYPSGMVSAGVAWVNPMDVVNATTYGKEEIDILRKEVAEQGPTDMDILEGDILPYINIEKTPSGDVKVTEQEGRHRMLRLADMGYTRVPVRFVNRNAESGETSLLDLPASGQLAGKQKGSTSLPYENLVEITPQNRQLLKSEFGQPSNVDKIKVENGSLNVYTDIENQRDNRPLINDFLVKEDKRGQGIGTNLIKTTLEKYPNAGANASNEGAVKAMYRAGMRSQDFPRASEDALVEQVKENPVYMVANPKPQTYESDYFGGGVLEPLSERLENWGSTDKFIAENAPETLLPQTDTKAFKNWFGKSAVVEETGQPMVLYRGERKDLGPESAGLTWRATPSYTPNKDVANVYTGSKEGSYVTPTYIRMENPLDLRAYGNEPANMLDMFGDAGLWGKMDDSKYPKLLRDLAEGQYKSGAEFRNVDDLDLDDMAALIENTSPENRNDVLEELLGNSYIDPFALADSKAVVKEIKKVGKHDGIILRDVLPESAEAPSAYDTYRPFEQTQVKSAIGNEGTFDPTTPVITKADGGEVTTDDFIREVLTEDQAVQDAERTRGEYLQQAGKEQKYENVYDALFRRNVDVKTNEDYRPDLLPIFRSAAVRAVMGERPTAGVDYEHYPALPSGVSSRGAVSDRKSRSKMTAADELSLVNDAIKSIGGGTLKVDNKGNLYLTDYYDFNMTDPTKIRDLYGAQRFGMGVLDKLGMLHNYRTELNLGNKYDLFTGLSKEEVDAALQRAKVQTFTPQGRKVVNPEPIGGTPDGA